MEMAQWLQGLGVDIHKVDNVSMVYSTMLLVVMLNDETASQLSTDRHHRFLI